MRSRGVGVPCEDTAVHTPRRERPREGPALPCPPLGLRLQPPGPGEINICCLICPVCHTSVTTALAKAILYLSLWTALIHTGKKKMPSIFKQKLNFCPELMITGPAFFSF